MLKKLDPSRSEISLDGFLLREISDFDASAIVGGAVVGVDANAAAFGDRAFTSAITTTYAKELASGGSIAFGIGNAIAVGDNPSTNVSFYGSGNIVLQGTSTYNTQNKSVSSGFIWAVSLPSLT